MNMVAEEPRPSIPLERHVIESLAEGVVWQDAEGRVVDANAAAAPILGLTHDELLGRTSRDPRWYAVHEDGSPWPGEDHPGMVALRSGTPQCDAIMGIIAPGAGRRWICIHAVPMRDAEGGPPTGVVVSFADVSRHIELRSGLQAATLELGELYNRAPCGYHLLDERGRFQRINDTELGWLGVTREEAVGRLGPLDFLSSNGKETFRQNFPRILAGERLDGLELELIGAQGQHRIVRLNAEPVMGTEGQFVTTRSVLHDITELHARTLALEKVNAEQGVVLNNDLISTVRLRDRKVVWANRAFDRIFGYHPGEMLGQSTAALFLDDEAFEAFARDAYPSLREGKTYRAQLRLRRKDGSIVWTDCSGTMLDPGTSEIIWFALDITEQRKAEELRVRSAELEAENRQLRETQRLHRLFLANMSHELRTPLNSVIGYSDLLRRNAATVDRDKVQRYAEQMTTSSRHLLAMIESILDTANAEAGRLEFNVQRVDAAQIVAEVVAMLSDKAAARSVAVRADVPPDLSELWLDPLRLRQILLVYVDNAIKFSHAGGAVDVRLRAQGSDHLCVEVEDHGIGIEPAKLPTLFSKFHQLSQGNTKAYEGAGIGLALVKLLVEAQGGTVSARSEPVVGSTFIAVLPTKPSKI